MVRSGRAAKPVRQNARIDAAFDEVARNAQRLFGRPDRDPRAPFDMQVHALVGADRHAEIVGGLEARFVQKPAVMDGGKPVALVLQAGCGRHLRFLRQNRMMQRVRWAAR
jgi:hypothetical protein